MTARSKREEANRSFSALMTDAVPAEVSPKVKRRRVLPKHLPKDDEPEPLWDTDQTAIALGLKPKSVRQRVWLRQIPFLKIGRSIRFRPSAIRKLLAEAEMPAREGR